MSGWYVDPSGRFEKRYYDGATWTTTVAVGDRTFVDAPVAVANAVRPWAFTALAGGALSVIAAFLPWAKASAGFFTATKDGIEGDGVLTLIAGAIVMLLAVVMLANSNRSDRWPAALILVGGLAIGGAGVYDLGDILDRGGNIVQPGAGLYLTVLAGAAVVVGAIGALAKSA